MLEHESWIGGDLWWLGFRATRHGHEWMPRRGGGGSDGVVNTATGGLGKLSVTEMGE